MSDKADEQRKYDWEESMRRDKEHREKVRAFELETIEWERGRRAREAERVKRHMEIEEERYAIYGSDVANFAQHRADLVAALNRIATAMEKKQ